MATIKQMLELHVWDNSKQEWVLGAPKTSAAAVETSDGGNVQTALDAVDGKISGATAELRGGVSADGDTLGKLYATIGTIKDLLQSDDVTLDTLQEIIDYVKAHGTELDQIGTGKVNYTDIVNALDTVSTVENKVLDARQGKTLKDLIDALEAKVNDIEIGGSPGEPGARPIISETPPSNPVNGQLWFKPAGVIEV